MVASLRENPSGRDDRFRRWSESQELANAEVEWDQQDPSGQQHVLPYMQPGYHTDRSTGTVYHLDQFGRYYFMQNNSGWWTPLQPGR